MGIEVNGRLHTIFETQKVSERFSKREFVLELQDNPKYPQLVLFQATGDRCTQLDDFAVGADVRVEFSLRGREWKSPKGETKYFNSLDVWRIEPAGASTSTQNSSKPRNSGSGRNSAMGDGESIPRTDDEFHSGDTDDLPF